MNKKLCFIIPYFGKFPNYFPLFLKSCAANPDFNWLIFTDDDTPYAYPQNVERVLTTFAEIKKLFESKFDFRIALDKPYKFCDFKPTYGYVFEDYLKDFMFWGHCDIDTIMGNLGETLTDGFLSQYDKIFALGHMTIYRNTPENNKMFMKEYKGRSYVEYLSKPENFNFDEDTMYDFNVHNLFKTENKRVFDEDLSLNFAVSRLKFRRMYYVGLESHIPTYGHEMEQFRKALYLWDRGNVCRYYMDGDKLTKENYLYLHLQSRPMYVMPGVEDVETFRISPNVFSAFDGKVDREYFQSFHPFVKYPELGSVRITYCLRRIEGCVRNCSSTVLKRIKGKRNSR